MREESDAETSASDPGKTVSDSEKLLDKTETYEQVSTPKKVRTIRGLHPCGCKARFAVRVTFAGMTVSEKFRDQSHCRHTG